MVCWHVQMLFSVILYTLAATVVQEKYGDQDDSDSSPSEIEDDTAYVSVRILHLCTYVLY